MENLVNKCTECRFWRSSQTSNGLYSCNKLMGAGNKPASIMFISNAPGDEEIKEKKPFVGLEGSILKKYIQVVGIKDYYYTYSVKCKPAFGDNITKKEIDICSKYLIEEIKQVQPKVIVALGSNILEFLGIKGGVTQARGIPVFNETYNCYIIPTYNPIYLNNFVDMSRQRREFTEDLAKILKISIEGQVKPLEVNYKYASTIAEVENITKNLLNSDWFSFDTETDGLDYFRSNILITSFSAQEGTGYIIPYKHPKGFNEQGQKEVKKYLDKLLDSQVKKIMQFGKFDLQMLFTAKIPIQRYAFDTYLAHALLDENSYHGLDKIVPIYTDMGNYKDEVTDYLGGRIKILKEGVTKVSKYSYLNSDNKKINMGDAYRKSTIFDCPYDKLIHYAGQDADATFRLFKKFNNLLEQEGLLKLLTQIMVPLSYVLAKMEYEGIGGDLEYAKRMADKLNNEIDIAEKNILSSKQVIDFMKKYQVPGEKFNIASSDQVSKLLFTEMGLKPVKYNKVTPTQKAKGVKKGSASVDTPSLRFLLEQNKIKLLEDLVKVGSIAKSAEYMEQYVDILSSSFDNRIHTRYNQVKSEQGGTTTGRLSSGGPNLQNIPSHNPEKAKLIRRVFVAKPGYTFAESDYSQIEFFIWAHVSEDPLLLKFVNNPKSDIHTQIASQVFKVPEDKITKTQRTIAKQTVYGMIYGRGSYSIAKEYGMTEDEVNRFINGFFKNFPKANQYIEEQIALMEKQGYTTNLFGRRRRALNIYSRDKLLKASAQRQARNFPLQSGAADLIYVAMIKLHKALLPYDAKMILQIHDSLVVEIKDEQLDTVISIIKQTMEKAINLKCALKIDVEVGKTLGEMQDYVPVKGI